MNNIFGVILVTAVAGILGTGIGGFLAIAVKRESNRIIGTLLGFAGGITLGTVCFDFISEAIHSGNGHDHSSLFTVALCAVLGFAAIYLLNRTVTSKAHHDHSCHSERCECCEKDPHKLIVAGAVMAVSIAIHNLPVGIVIGTSIAAAEASSFIAVGAVTTAVAIIFHNIPEGMAVTVPLISGGMKKSRALLLTLSCGASTVIGGVIGYSLGSVSPLALTVMLGLAAGAMLYVIFSDLIPEALSCSSSKTVSVAIFVGLLISMLIVFSGGHNHA